MTGACRRLAAREDVLAGVELWNARHPAFRIDRRLVEQNVYAPFDGLDVTAWGCYDDGDLTGFALAKTLTRPVDDYVGPEYGWISLLAVAPDADDTRAVGRRLLDAAETGLAATGVETVRFGGDPGNFLPGLPSALDDAYAGTLASAGYERGRTFFDLTRDLSSFESPDRVERVRTRDPDLAVERVAPDFAVERVGPDAVGDLLGFLDAQFPGRWQYEAENVVRRPGGPDDYWLLRNAGTPVGFARTNAPSSGYRGPNANWGWRLGDDHCGLGPLGIHEEYRGRGWGLSMLSEILDSLREEGYDHVVVDWTDLLDYYAKLGFEPWREYDVMRKEL